MGKWTVSVPTFLTASLCAVALSGCASQSGSAPYASPGAMDASRTRMSDASNPDVPAATAALRKLGYQLEWFVPDAVTEGVRFLDPVDDILLVHDGRNVLSAREVTTGKRRWSVTLATPVAKYVGNIRIDDRVLASSENSIQILSAKTGDLLERQRLATLANTAPLHLGRILVYGCSSGEVLGHDIATGYKKWGHMLEGRIVATPVRAGKRAIAVSQTGEVLAVDPITGRGSRPQRPLYAGLDNNPVTDGRLVVIAGLDQSIYGFNHADLSRRWRMRTDRPLHDQPTLHNRTAYVAIPDTGLRAIDGSSGDEKWTTAGVQGAVIATAQGDLIVWDGSTMSQVDPNRGDVVTSEHVPGVSKLITEEFADGALYLVTTDGTLAKYSRRRR